MKPWLDDGDVQLYQGHAEAVLLSLPEKSVQTCITSPPYWGLRDYGTADQIGLEATPEEYIRSLVDVFRQVRQVLRDDGTLWLNLGDSYGGPKGKELAGIPWRVAFALQADGWYLRSDIIWSKPNPMPESVTDRPTKAHEYLFLLSKQPRYYYDADSIREAADPGSIAREGRARLTPYSAPGQSPNRRNGSDGEWQTAGRNRRSVWEIATQPFPEAHFATYPEALVRPCILAGTSERGECGECGAPWIREVERGELVGQRTGEGQPAHLTPQGYLRNGGSRCGVNTSIDTKGWRPSCRCKMGGGTRNSPAPGSATFTEGAPPPIQPQTVLDPFIGSGTTALVARKHGRRAIGIDLSAEYLGIAARRLQQLSLLGEGA